MFYRDEVNRKNPNKHAGMVYSSNLCTEILQNMSPTTLMQEVISGNQIVTTRQAGDFVVCNLSSINLGRAVVAAEGQGDLISDVLERLVPIQVRMLDNVIDLNELPVPQATITTRKYRAIGLGTFGWHHLLALKGVDWNSAEAEEFSDALYERINYLAVQASMELAKEKGTYPVFAGSDCKRAYFRDAVQQPGVAGPGSQVAVNGLRNGWLLAVAPNIDRADRGQYRIDRPDLLGVLLRGRRTTAGRWPRRGCRWRPGPTTRRAHTTSTSSRACARTRAASATSTSRSASTSTCPAPSAPAPCSNCT